MNKLWHIHAINYYYSAIERNEVLVHATTLKKPEDIMLMKEARHKKPYIVQFHFYEMSEEANP